jgi:putative Mn2+ efflux pump MntP
MGASGGFAFAGFVAVAAGIAVLRCAWRRHEGWHAAAIAGGWAVLGAAVLIHAAAFSAEVGPAVAVTAFCIAGIAAAGFGLQVRAARAATRERFIDPSESPVDVGRALIRTLTTGVLTLIAALGVGMTFTACVPVAAPNAVVFGVFTTLLVWASLAVWAVTDARVLRTAAILLIVAAVAYGLAVSPGVCG